MPASHAAPLIGFAGVPQLAVNAGLSVLLMIAAALASWLISRTLHVGFRRIVERIAGAGGVVAARPGRPLIWLTQVVLWGATFSLLLTLWGLDARVWTRSPYAATAVRMALVLALAVAAWEIAVAFVEALFRRAAAHANTKRRAAQLRSLAPMMRGAVRTLIAIAAGLVLLSELGIEIAPLMAGAGIVGIAVGFGAQTLVKDYLTGFSLILEDIVSVGDIVRIGGDGGLVETMTLRTIRLRDFDGTLHVVPYSEAQIVHNLTKSFSYYVFDLPVSYDSDIDRALDLMRHVGAAMQRETQFRDKILEPIEVVGVDHLADSGVVLKARIKTAPIEQWSVGREYNRRIKLAFDEAGIEIPVPHVKLLLSDRALQAVRPS